MSEGRKQAFKGKYSQRRLVRLKRGLLILSELKQYMEFECHVLTSEGTVIMEELHRISQREELEDCCLETVDARGLAWSEHSPQYFYKKIVVMEICLDIYLNKLMKYA